MDILWLQNSVSRQYFVNAVTTLSEQLITINNVVNDLVSDGISAIVTENDPTNTPTNHRSNETLYSKKLINSIRENVACTHKHGFSGDTDNYLYQPTECAHESSLQILHRWQQHRLSPKCMTKRPVTIATVSSTTATTTATASIKNIKAIGNIVNLDIEKSGTISTYDCDSNYTTNATTPTKNTTLHSNYGSDSNFGIKHNVKNDKCNYNNTNKRSKSKGSSRTTSTTAPTSSSTSWSSSTTSLSSNTDSCRKPRCHSNSISIDSPMVKIAPISAKTVFHAQFDKYAHTNRSQWWKNLVYVVICYLFLLSSSLRVCSANKHEGNFPFAAFNFNFKIFRLFYFHFP